MNIKHGDIITLADGQQAKVSLEIVKKVTELVVNKALNNSLPANSFVNISVEAEKTLPAKSEIGLIPAEAVSPKRSAINFVACFRPVFAPKESAAKFLT